MMSENQTLSTTPGQAFTHQKITPPSDFNLSIPSQTNCARCNKELLEITPTTGIRLPSGKIFCLACALKGCEKSCRQKVLIRGSEF